MLLSLLMLIFVCLSIKVSGPISSLQAVLLPFLGQLISDRPCAGPSGGNATPPFFSFFCAQVFLNTGISEIA